MIIQILSGSDLVGTCAMHIAKRYESQIMKEK